MFNKITDKNTFDYLIQSPKHTIMIHNVINDNYFIVYSFLSIMDNAEFQLVMDNVKPVDSVEFKGVHGFYSAVSEAFRFMSKNTGDTDGFLEYDIVKLATTYANDVDELKEKCFNSIEDSGFFGNTKNIKKFYKEYLNE